MKARNNTAMTAESVYFSSLSLLSEQNRDPHPVNSPLETFHPDPMLSGSDAAPHEDLLMYLNNPNLFADSDFLEDDPVLPEFSLQEFHCLTPQPCGSIFQ